MGVRIKKIVLFCFLFSLLSCSNKGKQIPEFNLKTIDGNSISDRDLEGKITVMNVWATWCGSCLEEIPELNKLFETYSKDTSVLFLAMSDEPAEKIKHSLQQHTFNFKQIPEAAELTNALRTGLAKVYPRHFVIGRDMKIKFEHIGELENVSEVLHKEIEKAR